jgi:hypothetical protein
MSFSSYQGVISGFLLTIDGQLLSQVIGPNTSSMRCYAYPNPLPQGSNLRLSIESDTPCADVQYLIGDINGQILTVDRAIEVGGQIELNTANLRSGIYCIFIARGDNNDSWIGQFIVE